MLWRKPPADIAKVGVEGSNPFARSKFFLNDLGANGLSKAPPLSRFRGLSRPERTTGSARSVAAVDEFETVDCGVPLGLDPRQCAPQLFGGCPAAARQDHPADGEGDGENGPRWREGHKADEDGDQQRRPGDDRGSPGQANLRLRSIASRSSSI